MRKLVGKAIALCKVTSAQGRCGALAGHGALAVLVSTAWLGCGMTGGKSEGDNEAAASAPVDLERGFRAVLAASDITGHEVGAAPPGKQVTAVVVFASWCQPCRNELALLGNLADSEPRLRVIGVNYYEEFENWSDEERLRSFLRKRAPWLQVVRADDPLIDALGRPRKIPSLFLFDRNGKLVQSYLRSERKPPDRAELEQTIARVLL
ncbi:MAG: TlpA family protein disulfide reductase [Proteobacteria bacterium]|nr:TlpA family protein disulfide reductase [Pseudomonadota bacterium]